MTKVHLDHWPAGLPRHLPPPTGTLDDNLRRSARAQPEKPALIFYGAVKSYAMLDHQVTRTAAYLQSACNVKKGDRVGLYMQNAPQFIVGFYGIIRAGGVVVPINAMHLTEELAYICENAQIRTLLSAQDLLENVAPLQASGALDHVIAAIYASELPEILPVDVPDSIAPTDTALPPGVVDWADMMSATDDLIAVPLTTDDPCVMPYTSGSTGRAKGCIHTHATALHAIQIMLHWYDLTGDELHLGATPMFHIVGMQGIMNVSVASGGTIAIMSRWDRTAAAALIARHGVTHWCTVPTAVIDLLNTPGLQPADLSSLRVINGGGSAMPDAIAQRLADLTGLKFVEVYGMTETMGPLTHNRMDDPHSGCVGIPVMDTDLRLLDPDTQAEVPAGDVGEIVVCAPQVMRGYWQNPKANAETFITLEGQRFMRTGDLARADDAGNIVIVDRLKRMINASCYKVWPAEVEGRLYQHPAIAEVCVIGARDSYRGQTVKAVAVLKPGAQLEPGEFTSWAQGQMAAYKVPRLLDIVDQLPKTAAGKVLWRDLQAAEDRKTPE